MKIICIYILVIVVTIMILSHYMRIKRQSKLNGRMEKNAHTHTHGAQHRAQRRRVYNFAIEVHRAHHR